MERGLVNRWLTWLMVPATVALVVSALTLSRHAYTGVSLQGDRVATVQPGGPGARADLRPGDRVRPGPGSPPLSLLDSDPLRGASPGTPLALRRERGLASATVWVAPEPLPDGERRYRAFLLAIASVFVLLAGWVWSERRDHLTRVFLLLGLAFAAMLAPPPWLPPGGWQVLYDLGVTAAQLYVAVLFMHFFALFPDPAPRPRARWLVHGGYAIATALLLSLIVVVAESEWGAGRWRGALGALEDAHIALFTAGMLGGLVLFAGSFARARDADARRRLRVAFFGTVLGAAPFAAIVVWRNLSPGAALPGDRLVVASTLFVPASFAWAISIHRVFDFRVALRAAVTLAVLAALGFALYAAGEWMAASWWPALGRDVSGVSLAFLVLVAALAGPSRARVGALGARVVPIAGEVSLASWAPADAAARAEGPEAMLGEACECVRQALRLDGCAALVADAGGPHLAARAGSAPAAADAALAALGRGFLEAMGRQAGPRALRESELAADDHDALELAGVHWTLPVPGVPVAAVLLLGRRFAGAWLDRAEARDLDRLAHHLGVALENSELRREARHHASFARELREAHHVQVHRLPRRTPVYPTLDCAAVTLSMESVGGDYYDFVEAGGRDFTLAVGDAAGHGVPAALVLAGVQSRFRDLARGSRQPGDLLEALNHDLVAHEQPDRFMGLLCARVDVSRAIVRFANAGLTPPLVRRADGSLEELRESGLLLGVSGAAAYGTAAVELDAGDVVLVYTDGLTEASRGGRMFGVEGVRAVLDGHAHRRATDLLEELLAAVRAWADEPLDDLTLVVLKQLARPAGRSRPGNITLKPDVSTADTTG
jgi:sigma-B regulation protein RsbU (phosphoserine phosphatase)